MAEKPITAAQLKRLQTLFSKYAAGQGLAKLPADELRDLRLGFLHSVLDRTVESTKDLTLAEARRAIDELQKLLPPELIRKASPAPYGAGDRESNRQLGAAGRRGDKGKVLQVPDGRTLEKIAAQIAELGWTQDRFDAWLRSRSGPLGGRSSILTQADANRVHWALKAILKRNASPQSPAPAGAGQSEEVLV